MRGLLAITLAFGCGSASSAIDADVSNDSLVATGWVTGMPVAQGAIQETAAVAVAGKVYVIGGFDDTEGITARVQVYDTATATWSDGPPLPRALHHVNAATDGTTIYVAGALTGTSFAAVGDAYSFAPGTETQWQTRTPMPAGRERGSAVADMIGGKLYIAGGLDGAQAFDAVDVYDPVADSWTSLTPLPASRDHACGGTIAGQLVVAAGRTVATSSVSTAVWSYDPGSNTWTQRAAMPTARGGMGCGVIGDVLYTAGGERNSMVASGVFANVEAYTLATDSWVELSPMPTPKHGVAGAVWDGALYLCGGADRAGFGAIDNTDVFRP